MCVFHGGVLATISTQTQNDEVRDYLVQSGGGRAWIGGKHVNNAWWWQEGGTFPPLATGTDFAFENWAVGQPAQDGCTEIQADGRWYAHPCDNMRRNINIVCHGVAPPPPMPPTAPPSPPPPESATGQSSCSLGPGTHQVDGQCEISCDDSDGSGRRMAEEAVDLSDCLQMCGETHTHDAKPTGTREIISAYLSQHPKLAQMKLGSMDDETIAHFENIAKQLFGPPTRA